MPRSTSFGRSWARREPATRWGVPAPATTVAAAPPWPGGPGLGVHDVPDPADAGRGARATTAGDPSAPHGPGAGRDRAPRGVVLRRDRPPGAPAGGLV